MKEHLGSVLPGEARQAEQTHSLGCSIPTAPRGTGYRTSFVNKAAASKEPWSACAPIPSRHSGDSTPVLPGMEHRRHQGFWRLVYLLHKLVPCQGGIQVPGKGI